MVQANFHTDCRGMQAQLLGLSSLMSILDPQLTSFLVRTIHPEPIAPDKPQNHLLIWWQFCSSDSGAEDILPV